MDGKEIDDKNDADIFDDDEKIVMDGEGVPGQEADAGDDENDNGDGAGKSASDADSEKRESVRGRFSKLTGDLRERDQEIERLQNEIKKRDSLLESAKDVVVDKEVENLEKTKGELVSKLRKAKEDGNTEDEIKFEDELSEVRQKLFFAKVTKQRRAEQKTKAPDQPGEPDDGDGGDGGGQQPAKLHPKTAGWLKKETWFGRLNDRSVYQAVIAIDSEVAEEFDKGDDQYYRELEARIDERFPELRRRGYVGRRMVLKGGAADDSARPPAPPLSHSEGRDGERARRRGRPRLTEAQITNMRRFKLNPENPDDVDEYLSNAS